MVSVVYDWIPLSSKSFGYEDIMGNGSFQHDKNRFNVGNSKKLKRDWSDFVGNDVSGLNTFSGEYYQNGLFSPLVDYLGYNFANESKKIVTEKNVFDYGYLKDSTEDITSFMEQMLEPETEKNTDMKLYSEGLERVRDEYDTGCELNSKPYHDEFKARNIESCWMTGGQDWNGARGVASHDVVVENQYSFQQRKVYALKGGLEEMRQFYEYDDSKMDHHSTPYNKSQDTADIDMSLKESQTRHAEYSGYAYGVEEDYNDTLLVHLLIACAEAVSNDSKDLAAVILARLHDLVSFTGNTIQRVAYYFTQSFQYLLDGINDIAKTVEKSENSLGAFQILYEVLPYAKFAHFTANQAILEAIEGESQVHIVDFDILEGLQWPPFMKALALRSEEIPSLRITAIGREQPGNAMHSSIRDTGRRLSEFAETLGIPFQFEEVVVEAGHECDLSALNICQDEALAVNCMFGLPHMPPRGTKSISAFLTAVSRMHPKVLILGEELVRGELTDFMSLFKEILHHHCAVFNSLEASLCMQSLARLMVECLVFAPRICDMVGSMASKESEDGDWKSHKSRLAEEAGFQAMKISDYNRCQANLLLDMFKDGYSIEEEHDQVVLCWDERQIVSVSEWAQPLLS
ncbi:hypothetical protein O6H91_20G010400 [Diphasiastrum complanatum]|uniref:Uncharacterized protein n=2 Tax=Diphasiastrum complanatum TaxID=34168 RepID=A0ACC2AMS2_DIPCM|nr:hypothetical protein O6H91_20G009400 [Diphasiastrum complanatum]KAJ7518831.1 hypothetical protein O6H91_20G010400 [Diphasiastrum complanatum]